MLLPNHLLRAFAITLFFPFLAYAAPPKRALLVAVGNYPPESGWQKINSRNDITLVKAALLKQGFSENEIVILEDEAATKEGILRAIREQLVDKAEPGGVAYFHFSGHGQQVADDNGDELDGYDEAIVPINSPMHYEEGIYEGENLIRDDELGKIFKLLRRKLGPTGTLQVLLDACHSGTGTRGFGVARGTTYKMASENYNESNLNRGTDKTEMESFDGADESGLAPMVAFFGAAQNQLNFETRDEEGRGVGSLSYAFSKKIASASPSTTYRGLFEQIRLEMSAIAPRQQPQAEGALDLEILGGRLVGKPSFFRVKQWNDPGSVILEAGWLQGVYEGSVVGLYPPETRNSADNTPYSKGTVSFAGATTSTIILDVDVDQRTALGAWAFMLEQNFGDLKLSVKNDLQADNPILPFLKKRLEKVTALTQEEPADLYLTDNGSASRGAAVQLITKDDIVIETFPDNLRPEILADRIVREMLAFGQARFIKNMELTSYDLPVELELIPVKINRRTMSVEAQFPLASKQDASGTVHFQDGDVLKVKVTNHGNKPAYFTLLDIQPDNQINVLIPQANETPAEFLVAPGQSVEVNRFFEIGPPVGTEVFKLVATDQPIDLRPISSSRGAGTKSSPSGFERLFSQTYFNEDCMTRGGKTISISTSDVNVSSFTFMID
ncbi:MAG: caspase family protein [Saprospiraceae bacterium]